MNPEARFVHLTIGPPRVLWLMSAVWVCLCLRAAADSPAGHVALNNQFISLSINTKNGHCEVLDRRTDVVFGGTSAETMFGSAILKANGRSFQCVLRQCEVERADNGSALTLSFHPEEVPGAVLRVRLELLPEAPIVQVTCEAGPDLRIESISPLANILTATEEGKGYVLIPVREGLLIPANSGLTFTNHFDTYAYEGCHMRMAGVVQNGAAALATWEDPYVAVVVQSTIPPKSPASAGQRVGANLMLSKSAQSFQLHFLGHGDYVTIAKAYREVATQKGLRVPWTEKLRSNPERAKLFGAANVKLWSALDRRMNEASTQEEHLAVNWTFDEAAQVAEHLKKDLQLERVLFTLGGWIHRGYDNQHPDILPTAPECGGDPAFADCARRVLQLGYLFCLHDNYQDIYRDSPSWDEKWVMKLPDGKLAKGGHWAGGLAYITCSEMALQLAQRPQNLAAVKELSRANAYFIDTTYAAGLQECFDPNHPLTRAEDMKWKQALSDYARGVFGVFGSECGREWAIAHSDFFEGLTGVSGRSYHDSTLPDRLGAAVVPLFELVYRECIAMYGKYGYDPDTAARYVLEHISLGRPLNYHSIPAHLYWKTHEPLQEERLALSPSAPEFVALGPRQFEMTYRWSVAKRILQPWKVFVHFTDASGSIRFQNDQDPRPAIPDWTPGEIRQGPFTVTVPPGLTGRFEVRTGLYDPGTGSRALLRVGQHGDRSYPIGKLEVSGAQLRFEPAKVTSSEEGLGLFTRGDNGWSAGLDRTDRFLKNTYEILSPLNELTAQLAMTRHEFATADRKVQRTLFGEGPESMTVTINLGESDYACALSSGQRVTIPALGFVVESKRFVAFHSRNWGGLDYGSSPPLFTMRSLDEKPLSESHRVRVYHGFGDDRIRLDEITTTVAREAVVDPRP